MSAIGGYFELELNQKAEYHPNAIRVNTGRNAFEYILLANKYKKVYIPYYTCAVLLEPLVKNKIQYEYYPIDYNFEPKFDFKIIKKHESFLYTNYWGLKDQYISQLAVSGKNIIIDNAQAFYSKPIEGVSTFYSPRKFFGVPDGGYLFTEKTLNVPLLKDSSNNRVLHLIQRIDQSAKKGYKAFKQNETLLHNLPLLEMSALSKRILESIDYKNIAIKRIRNFKYLSIHLNAINKINLSLCTGQVPMVYPFISDKLNLKNKLIYNNIYTGQYWKEVNNIVPKDSAEHLFTNNLICLPIDQRYKLTDMNIIIKTITNEY